MTTDDDWMEVIFNLKESRKIWSHLDRILGREVVRNAVVILE